MFEVDRRRLLPSLPEVDLDDADSGLLDRREVDRRRVLVRGDVDKDAVTTATIPLEQRLRREVAPVHRQLVVWRRELLARHLEAIGLDLIQWPHRAPHAAQDEESLLADAELV